MLHIQNYTAYHNRYHTNVNIILQTNKNLLYFITFAPQTRAKWILGSSFLTASFFRGSLSLNGFSFAVGWGLFPIMSAKPFNFIFQNLFVYLILAGFLFCIILKWRVFNMKLALQKKWKYHIYSCIEPESFLTHAASILNLPLSTPCSMSSKLNTCPPMLYAVTFQKSWTFSTELGNTSHSTRPWIVSAL